jgi:threonylcarbamoyladenosine tRNA methylthiotransferase MtaB
MPFAYFHVFSYSRRAHTRAAAMPDQIPPGVARERSRLLRELSARKSAAYHARFVGTAAEVLVEGRDETGRLTGRTDYYMKVHLPGEETLVNTFVPVEILETDAEGAHGTPVR